MALFASTWRGNARLSFVYRGFARSLGDKGRQPCLKGLLYAFRIG